MGLALTIPPSAGAAGIAQVAGASSPAAPGASNGFATLLAETASQSPDAPAADLLAQLLAEQHGRGNGLATAVAAVGDEEHPEGTPAEDSTTLDIVLPASAAINAPAAPAVAQSAAAHVPASAPAAMPPQAQSAATNVPAGVPAAVPPQAQVSDEAAPATAQNPPQQAVAQAQASTGPPTLPANASSAATDHAPVETPRLGAEVSAAAKGANGSGDPRATALAVLATVPASPKAIEAVSAAGPASTAPAPADVPTTPASPAPTPDVAQTPAAVTPAATGTNAPVAETVDMSSGAAPPPDIPPPVQDGVVRIVGNAQETATAVDAAPDVTGTNGNEASASIAATAGESQSGGTSSSGGELSAQEGETPVATFTMTEQGENSSQASSDVSIAPATDDSPEPVTERASAVGTAPALVGTAAGAPEAGKAPVPMETAAGVPEANAAPAQPQTLASTNVSAAAVAPSTASVAATTAPTASATATPPPVMSTQPTAQVTQAVIEQLLPDGGRVTLRLNPPELGEVTLRMTITAERVSLEAVVERPEAVTIIRESQEALERLLAERGLELVDVFVGLRQGQGGDSQRRSSDANSNEKGEFAAFLNGDDDDQQTQSQHQALRAAYNPDGSMLYRV